MKGSYKLLILSFFLLNLFLWISQIDYIYGIPQIVKYTLSVIILGIIVSYRLANPLTPAPGRFYYYVIIVFIAWSSVLLIFESLKFNSLFYIQRIFGQPYFIIPYILPLFLLYSKFDLKFFSDYFHYSSLLIIPAILIQLYLIMRGISPDNFSEPLARINIFNLGSSFLLLTAHFSKKKYIFNFVFLYSLLMVFIYAQFGRRTSLLEYLLIFCAMIIMRIRSSQLHFNDRMKMYFAGLVLVIISIQFGHLATSSFVFQRGFNRGAFEASRGTVFTSFFHDFNSTTDFIFGRGLEGRVLRSLSIGENADFIENGFLTLLLKGGVLYLIPFLILLLRASYLGFYRSNNDLVKALAALLLIYVIIMFPFNVPSFSTKYVFMWISIAACFRPDLRNVSNEGIYQIFNNRDSN